MSFGGGDSPSGTTFQTQFTRDAPQIEARKMGLKCCATWVFAATPAHNFLL